MRREYIQVAESGVQGPLKRAFDPELIQADFPILKQLVHGKPLVYLDNAATTQKPQYVLQVMNRYYENQNSNVHRGVHSLSQLATELYEGARGKVRRFLHARSEREIIFTRGTTEGINLVAQTFGRRFISAGDEIIISTMEHHSNIVPWQLLCEQTGATLRVIPINDAGELLMDEYEAMLNERTRIVSVVHVSNALGTINPVRRIIDLAHEHNIPVLLDGAQSVQHVPIDVQELDCDFFVFSGHKLYGPTGIGVLYGKEELLDSMPPFMGGGDMILHVTFEKTTYNELPYKFEAGTPNIAGAIGLGAAIDYFSSFDIRDIQEHEHALLEHASAKMSQIPGLIIIGTASEKTSVASFMLCAVHPHDIGTILDKDGIAIRAGHHCAQPTMKRMSVPATARASFAMYNTKEDVDMLMRSIDHVLQIFA